MADLIHDPEAGAPLLARAGQMARLVTAAVSLSLVVGAGVWGYRLMARDASGIPVVRAMAGPMRERPVEAGGEVALHTGLAVNAVAALGSAAPTEERLVLAPQTQGLTEDDLIARPVSFAENEEPVDPIDMDGPAVAALVSPEAAIPAEEAPVAQPVALAESPAEAAPVIELTAAPASGELTAEQIQALADQIAADAAPLTALAGAVEVIPDSVPGVSRAWRPPSRPSGLDVTEAAAADPLAAVSAVEPAVAQTAPGPALREEEIAVGTALVQLGAFPSQEAAGTAWNRISRDFADYISGREPIVQQAASAGQTFYRLRALGFDDLGDARRFCSALVAEGADCIPVIAR